MQAVARPLSMFKVIGLHEKKVQISCWFDAIHPYCIAWEESAITQKQNIRKVYPRWHRSCIKTAKQSSEERTWLQLPCLGNDGRHQDMWRGFDVGEVFECFHMRLARTYAHLISIEAHHGHTPWGKKKNARHGQLVSINLMLQASYKFLYVVKNN